MKDEEDDEAAALAMALAMSVNLNLVMGSEVEDQKSTEHADDEEV